MAIKSLNKSWKYLGQAEYIWKKLKIQQYARHAVIEVQVRT